MAVAESTPDAAELLRHGHVSGGSVRELWRGSPEATHDGGTGRLSPIFEESDTSSWPPGSNATEFRAHEDPAWHAVLDSLQEDWSAVPEGAPPQGELDADRSERLPLAHLQQTYLDVEVRPPMPQAGDEEGSGSAELADCPPMTNAIPDAHRCR